MQKEKTEIIAILLVEDQPADAVLLMEMLEENTRYDWQVTHVKRLSEALETLADNTFHIALLDLSLPDSQGLNIVNFFQEKSPSLPIIVMTGLDSQTLAVQAVQKGAQDYLVKGQINSQFLVKSILYARERGKNQQMLLTALEKEKELNELKTKFVSLVSHQLKNPLTVIKGASELLRMFGEKMTPETHNQCFEQIHHAVEQMLQLIDEVLVVGKVDEKKLFYRPVTMNFQKFCQDLVASYTMQPDVKQEIVFNYHGECQSVIMDKNLLQHIFQNILSNAIKYSSEDSQIKLNVECGNGIVICEIIDQGIGISEKSQKHLFEKFYRGDNVGVVKGTGLGLSILQECVNMHYGFITVNSILGQGTTFIVTLPTQPPDGYKPSDYSHLNHPLLQNSH
jgi:signal transduction histidine kinase